MRRHGHKPVQIKVGDTMTLGEKILRCRAKRGLTQREMDELLNVPIGTTHRIESEKHKPHKAKEIQLTMKIEEMERGE